MKRIKRYAALLITAFMVLSVLLTGCGSTEPETAAQESLVLATEAADAGEAADEQAAYETDAEQPDEDGDAAEAADEQAAYATDAETLSDDEAQADGGDDEAADEAQADGGDAEAEAAPEDGDLLDEDGYYYSKDKVALYIYQYGKLPDNYITKKEAEELGWSGGSLEKYAPGKVIGGSRFGNYEGLLPKKKGRQYYECDIDTLGKKRGAKRIVFSDDGLIYYTEDHYESFELLYGEE